MAPLMTAIYDHIRLSCLDRYIDGFERDAYVLELDRLYQALSAALPESCHEILVQYSNTLALRANLDTEAMFQAAFAAARELS